ncbi:antA/AntB antirepressor family protein [Actinobacillus genomosp. 2]|uniref:antA/AntB antirepressor family protein n=1 Tax=Actinobacillus genomosp. 2 TaxID=230709 RepID=UPI0024414401|nr:antA/AntB antirepressor family protein [Actinobacillus genomosp. 2]WGE31513.1 antA/AntB antirepressor family protein [Actinobacillus genomosp. 2]
MKGLNDQLPVIQTLQKGGLPQQLINARDLWQFLESKQRFADWFKNAVNEGLFKSGKDYFLHHKFMKQKMNNSDKRGGHNRKDYAITLSMAKEIAMLERNAQGKLARQYFIQCEEKLAEIAPNAVAEYRQEWKQKRNEAMTPYKRTCEALKRCRERLGKPTESHIFTNEANMLSSLAVGMSIQQWKQAHGITTEPREAFNAEQLEKLTYLEQADEMLLDLGIIDFQQRKAKLGEMLAVRFSGSN